MRVLVAPDYRTLSRTASALVLKAVRTKRELTLGLPTGNTPLGMYEELVRSYREQQMDFSGITTFNLDEYLGLQRNDPNSYRFYMQQHFFDHVNIPAGNVHIPEEAAGYEEQIQEAGGIDLLVVGIGLNGHIAFNEPGSSFASRTREVMLAAETIANAETHFEGAPVPTRAVTIGIGTILESRCVVLLVSGASKADIVRRALNGPVSASVPASALQLHQNVIAILDEDANPDEE